LLLLLASLAGTAADYPAPQEGGWVAKDFRSVHLRAEMTVPVAAS